MKHVILSNMYDEDLYQFAKDTLIDNGIENPTETAIWDEYNWQMEANWEEDKSYFENYFDNYRPGFIAAGSISRWNGLSTGYTIFATVDDIIGFLKDATEIEIYDDNGHLMVSAYHHDGNYSLQIKELTERGAKYLDNTDNAAKCFADSHYARLPRFWKHHA